MAAKQESGMRAGECRRDTHGRVGQLGPGLYGTALASTAILQTLSEHIEDKVQKKKKKHLNMYSFCQPPKY